VAGAVVYVSAKFGPAVFGFIRPRIVLPEWVRATSAEEQRLIVLHEHEHISAADHLLLLLVVAVTAWMPWNPFMWFQTRRLRFALEADCDQRVLNEATADAKKYAQLLVDVGGRQTGLLVTAALAEHRNGLERRIGMIATRIVHNRWKAAAFAVVSVVLGVVACESRLPSEPQQPQAAMVSGQKVRVAQATRVGPDAPMATVDANNINDLMSKYYPPLLRDAGVGGVARVRVHVNTLGVVENIDLLGGSGKRALDEAALRVAQEASYKPAHAANGELTKSALDLLLVFGKGMQPTLREEHGLPRKVSTEEPGFTPYTDRPELQNREDIAAALVRAYPKALRDHGVSGTALIWVLVDRDGSVLTTKVNKTSGQPEIDEAAMRVAKEMKFKPALNNGDPVAVWIQMPIAMKPE
jgi:TonB family protein